MLDKNKTGNKRSYGEVVEEGTSQPANKKRGIGYSKV
jgi:hypothetical protein